MLQLVSSQNAQMVMPCPMSTGCLELDLENSLLNSCWEEKIFVLGRFGAILVYQLGLSVYNWITFNCLFSSSSCNSRNRFLTIYHYTVLCISLHFNNVLLLHYEADMVHLL